MIKSAWAIRSTTSSPGAADSVDAGNRIHLLIFTHNMNLIAMTGIQGHRYDLRFTSANVSCIRASAAVCR
ncbi:hypothetical protein KCP69_03905 [Salmonella enterica subsp. enterica]|nr:hypothetical protein KCP69_03905 [Salmonella enterica subsp. enterica]